MPKPSTQTEPCDAWAVAADAPLLGKASALALAACALGLLFSLTA
ncbi:MAG TPA: hypothetical protein VF876_05130 [Burkholderiales bacterium]